MPTSDRPDRGALASERALAGIEAFADAWIAETDMHKAIASASACAAGPFKDRLASVVYGLVSQAYVEAFYAGFNFHKDGQALRSGAGETVREDAAERMRERVVAYHDGFAAHNQEEAEASDEEEMAHLFEVKARVHERAADYFRALDLDGAQEDGRGPADTGSREPDPSVPASGFDPSRKAAEGTISEAVYLNGDPKITWQEMRALFGDTMPAEALLLISDKPLYPTIADTRAALSEIAERHRALGAGAAPYHIRQAVCATLDRSPHREALSLQDCWALADAVYAALRGAPLALATEAGTAETTGLGSKTDGAAGTATPVPLTPGAPDA